MLNHVVRRHYDIKHCKVAVRDGMDMRGLAPMHFDDLPACAMGAGTLHLARCWDRWRGGRLLPMKSSMDLNDIKAILPWIGLLEVVDAETVRLRVAGTALVNVYGVEMTGKNIKEITAPADWPTRSGRYRALVRHPCGSYFLRLDTLQTGKAVAYETLALPLDVDAAGSVRHVIYCVAPLHEEFALERPTGPRAIPMAQGFKFVDVGAGIPAAV